MSDVQPETKTEAVPEAVPQTAADDVVVSTELKNIIEALIFASDEPMTTRFIRSIMDDVNKDLPPSEHYIVNAEIIRKAVGDLNRGYVRMGSGFRIIEIAGGFTYATQENFSSWVGKLAKEKARRRLSPTAVETLAIIAYKQPIAKGEVEFIRGVNVDYIINALLEKDLIHITGRANTPGRPLLYGTTQKFLEHFGLNDLTDLPKPREISELINETEIEVDRRLLAEQQELEFKEDLEKKLEGNEGSKNKPQKQPKVKVPENIKEENRRGGKQSGTAETAPVPADDKAADGQRSAEGETSSESNLTIEAATADVRESAAEHPLVSEQDRSVENVPAEAEVLPEVSAASRVQHSEPAAEGMTGDAQTVPMTGDRLAVPENDEPADRISDVPEQQEIEERDPSMTGGTESPVSEGPDRSAVHGKSVGKEVMETVPESPSAAGPADHQPGGNLSHASMEGAEGHSERSTGGEQPDRQESPQGTETGWSKWKNKVKTFFQKLFA
jgi:segregation and condensation protein B